MLHQYCSNYLFKFRVQFGFALLDINIHLLLLDEVIAHFVIGIANLLIPQGSSNALHHIPSQINHPRARQISHYCQLVLVINTLPPPLLDALLILS